jgi:hypothetical protein
VAWWSGAEPGSRQFLEVSYNAESAEKRRFTAKGLSLAPSTPLRASLSRVEEKPGASLGVLGTGSEHEEGRRCKEIINIFFVLPRVLALPNAFVVKFKLTGTGSIHEQ